MGDAKEDGGRSASAGSGDAFDRAGSDLRATATEAKAGEAVSHVRDDDFMVDKRSGRVASAVMRFGGFLGVGESYHPLPWDVLTYNPERGGYVVALTRERLQSAPSYTGGAVPDWADQAYGRRIDNYYGAPFGI